MMLAGTFSSITFLLTISFWALSYDISGKLEFGDAFFLGICTYIHLKTLSISIILKTVMYIHSKNLSAIFISKVSLLFLQMITSGAGFCYCCKILCCNHAKYTAGFVIEPKDFGQQVIQVPYSPQQLQIHQYPNQNQNHQPYQEKSIQTGSSEVHAPYIKIIQ